MRLQGFASGSKPLLQRAHTMPIPAFHGLFSCRALARYSAAALACALSMPLAAQPAQPSPPANTAKPDT